MSFIYFVGNAKYNNVSRFVKGLVDFRHWWRASRREWCPVNMSSMSRSSNDVKEDHYQARKSVKAKGKDIS